MGKYIIELDESEIVECWNEQATKELGYQEYALKQCPKIKVKPYNPSGDCISREALKEAISSSIAEATEAGMVVNADYLWELLNYAIDNAPTVEVYTKDDMAGAYNEGYMCGSREAEKARPQGEYVDISKLRLMKVEECAGHTIDYAMGWKACIEWIKKGGAE